MYACMAGFGASVRVRGRVRGRVRVHACVRPCVCACVRACMPDCCSQVWRCHATKGHDPSRALVHATDTHAHPHACTHAHAHARQHIRSDRRSIVAALCRRPNRYEPIIVMAARLPTVGSNSFLSPSDGSVRPNHYRGLVRARARARGWVDGQEGRQAGG